MAGTYSKVKTVITGEVITASDRNAEHNNHITNADFSGLGDFSANNTEFQTTKDPFPSASESLPTDGKEELQVLRFQILQIGKAIGRATGFTQWYFDLPDPTAALTIIDVDNTATDGDPGFSVSLSGTKKFTWGCDDGDGDVFKFGTTAMGTQTAFEVPIGGNQFQANAGSAGTPGASFIGDPNSGWFSQAADSLGCATGGAERFRITTTAIEARSSGTQIVAQAGSAAAPSYSFNGDLDSGLFAGAANRIGIVAGGSEILRVTTTTISAITSTTRIEAQDGTAGSPGYRYVGDPDSGWFSQAANVISAAAGGGEILRISTTAIEARTSTTRFRAQDGDASSPGYTFAGDVDTGMAVGAANILIFASNGIETFRSDASNRVHIQTSGTADAQLEVSDGSSTGGGTVHRATAATHSMRDLKSDITYLDQVKEKDAYNDLKTYKHTTFRYKKRLPSGLLVADMSQPIRKGMVYEEVPDSIKDGNGAIVIDHRIMNLEMAMKELIRMVEAA